MKTSLPLFTLLFFFLLAGASLSAQSISTVRGLVIDRQSEMPLIGVAVELISAEPVKGTVTDVDGRFELTDVPVGRQVLRFTYLGYEPTTIPNVVVTAGKDVSLEIGLEESVLNLQEIVVTAGVDKDKTQNDMAAISARSFTVEEVTRYSGGRNDVARMAANFAGVNIADDSRNDIVIRGNSPTGVLWRLEGVPIPNPNHFSTLGTTGGPVSAVNPNLLKNSDFLTSAFPAEYGNALAGVFDLGMRSGNRERVEFTAQLAAFSGLEAMAEGPLPMGQERGSFLVSYRHAFTEIAQEVGLDLGATPRYKDLTFKIDLPRTGAGQFSLFGIGADSDIDFLAVNVDRDNPYAEDDANSRATSRLGVIGLNHRLLLGNRTYLRTTLAASSQRNTYYEEKLIPDNADPYPIVEVADREARYTFSTYLNHKANARWTVRAGVLGEYFDLKLFLRERDINADWQTYRDTEEGALLLQPYAQLQYKPAARWTINAGLHGQYLGLNDKTALGPRLAANYELDERQTLSFGYGLHHQMQPLPVYFVETYLPDGRKTITNLDLGFTGAHHFVLGYDRKLGQDWRIKVESYYQDLFNAAVEQRPTTYSVINLGADFGFPLRDSLVNEGSGRNYGLELTVEKFFSRGYYALFTGSLFDSEFTPGNGIQYNSAFNNNYTANFLFGKEWLFGRDKRNAFTFDTKFTAAGGRYYTPLDLAASQAQGEAVYDDSRAFSERYPAYLRLDVKFGYRLNSKNKRFSQQFFLDFQNVTNHKNVFSQRFDKKSGDSYYAYQTGFFPDMLWRVQF